MPAVRGATPAGLDRGVSALVIDPKTPSTLYAGTEFGGVFRSTDAGSTWRGAPGAYPTLREQVRALALDPATPSTVYAATDSGPGGVFKSTDGGDQLDRH